MDMPAIISEYFPGIKIEKISEAIADYQPAWLIVRNTWSNETIREIMEGKVSVPDEVINKAIADKLDENQPVTEVKLTSKKNGKLDIYANTKKAGRVEFSGTIEEFVHNTEIRRIPM